MKGTTIILLCAVGIALGRDIRYSNNKADGDSIDEKVINDNPEEASAICAAADSDGILVAHEYCNRFYKCANSNPAALRCQPGLLYNPYKEACDWPNNVDCGDRVIPPGNDNPAEAPVICAATDSEGVLVAHEHCNKFYKCAHSLPAPLSCEPGLLYNPYKEACDWPNNVDCGDRIIPDTDEDDVESSGGGNGDEDNNNNVGGNDNPADAPAICAAPDSEGVLVAHEHCNKFYKCAHGLPAALPCQPGLLYNPYKEACDWPNNVDCGDRIIPESDEDDDENNDSGNGSNGDEDDNDNVGGNDNPADAPAICAAPDSEGVLVAHEHCNKFYKCSHGLPAALPCQPGLLYNPYKEACDWPNNVDCGDRIIPDSDEDDDENNDSGNGSNGDEDDNNNVGGNDNPADAPAICAAPGSEGVLVAHEHCNKFYKCTHGLPAALPCQPGLLYNPYKEACDWPNNVDCGDRIIPDSDEDDDENNDSSNGSNGDEDDNNNVGGNDNPADAPAICAAPGSEGVLVAHEHCNKFYKCSHGLPAALPCQPGLLYNPYKEACDWPNNVDCGDRIIPDSDEDDDENNDSGNGSNGDEDDNNNVGGNDNPADAPAICAAPGSEGVLVAHEHCNKFYKCSHGLPAALPCQPGLLYNPYKEACDWPNNVDCGDRIIPDSDEDDDENNDSSNGSNGDEDDNNNVGGNDNPADAPAICAAPGSEGVLVAHEHCNKFYKCSHGLPAALPCQPGLLYNPYKEACDWPNNVDCGDRIIPDSDEDDDENNESGNGSNGDEDDNNNVGGNDNPADAPAICAAPGSEGVLVAHEHCNKFYKCAHGLPAALPCQPGLLYNPYKEACDWPNNVDCGDRIIPESDEDDDENNESGNGSNGDEDDNDNVGGNDNPADAPAICSAPDSEGVLVAHEHCNKFYKCAHGLPAALPCQPGLLYNPYKEACDWPNNVDCGDRIIPESDEDDDENNDSGSGSNEDEDDNNNVGGNDNPADAPAICSAPDSEGVLVAHEHCNKFYKCAHGLPAALPCQPGLLYNPYKEACDWPNNVDCGDRIIPESDVDDDENNDSGNGSNGDEDDNNNVGGNDNPADAPAICAAPDSEGVLVAHEHCNKFYKCAHGLPAALPCQPGLLYNPYKEACDWPNNVDCGDRIIPESDEDEDVNNESGNGSNGDEDDNNNVGGNDNPADAPAICSAPDSEGVLVAHEHCNKFYKCAHGLPAALPCQPGLLYNPYKEACDWPNNVDCGDRIIPESDVDDDENNDSGNGSNGDEDDNNNVGGNDNPADAPAICAAPDSEGVLVAHEHCNKFYKCAHGLPAALPCQPGLLYNPYKEACDWPNNVDCGDRIIPDSDENDDENNDSGNGSNGDEDDNNNVGGNDNPADAPAICAAPGSEGVLVAHEHCNKFYKCAHGLPAALPCQPGLLYNPYKEACDWPNNVDCGDRIIPDSDENDDENNDSGNGSNGDEDDNNNVGGNDNPADAPAICSAPDSEGVLVAHEHCNKFYKCAHGLPAALPCQPGLLYNPYKEACDWPNNVDCGDRIIPDSDEDDDENNDSGNGSNGDEDDNNNVGGNDNPADAPAICAAPGSEGVLVAHEHCNKFYKCAHGLPAALPCQPGLLYNPYKEACDWPNNVDCGDRIIPESDEDDDENNESGNGSNGDEDDNDNVGGNDNPADAPAICSAPDSEGVLVAHEHCNKFYKCAHGLPAALPCQPGLLYNPYKEACDWPNNVDCGERIIPESDENDDENNDSGNGSNGDEDDNNNVGGNDNPADAPAICAAPGSEGVLVAHEHCNKFYKCAHGLPAALPCQPGLLYNPYKEACDWPNNVDCGDRIIPDSDENDDENNDSGNGSNGDEDDNNNVGGNDNPADAPAICAAPGSEGVLVAHEHCNKFYKCAHGLPAALPCQPGLLYNPYKEACDWPNNVDCGDRIIPDSDENDDENNDSGNGSNGDEDDNNNVGGNDNPADAPAICAAPGSEGVLVAHEHCNKFYKCAHGLPAALPCQPGLLYNPYKEACDWPNNVDCGDRIIPDSDEDDDENNDSGNGSNGDEDDNNNVGGNDNPADAPAICAAPGSEGVLVAHEHCNKFYKCAHGLPAALPCQPGLLYNPYKEACDWPNNVDCGDRIIPDSDENDDENNDSGNGSNGDEDDNNNVGGNDNPADAPAICAAPESEGVLVAHEYCNRFYKCANGKPAALRCQPGLLYNPYKEACDWPNDVDCGDRVIPAGNDNPAEAPAICAATDSEGVLVAHEHCEKFYKCAHGLPAALSCETGLLYNPYKEACDWPNDVDCGDRIIGADNDGGSGENNFRYLSYASLNKHLEARQRLRK